MCEHLKTFDQLSYNSLRPSCFCVYGAAILRETRSCFHSFSGLKTLLVTLKDPGVEVHIKDKYVRRREEFLAWPLVAAAMGDDKKTSGTIPVHTVPGFKCQRVGIHVSAAR